MGAVDAYRDEFHVRALATDVVETAAELSDRFARTPRAFGEEDQRVLVAEPLDHLLDRFASPPVDAAAEVGEKRAIDQDGIEDPLDVVAAEPAALPVIPAGDRSRSFTHVPRK